MMIPAPIRRLVLVREGEAPALVWSAAYFFFLLCSYYVLRPVREMSGIERGAEALPWLMTGTMAAMFLANPLFAWLVSRLPRRRFIPATYHVFALMMLVFWGVMRWMGSGEGGRATGGQVAVGYAFYIWVSVFNLFAVSVFWAFLADMFTTEQSKRLFGVIGVGGTLGAIIGAAATASLVKRIGSPFNMLLVSAVLLEAAVFCIGRLKAVFRLDGGAAGSRGGLAAGPRGDGGEPGPGVLTGVGLVARSPYLLLICVYLFAYAALATFLYLEQGRVVDAAITDRNARTAFFADIDLYANILTIVTQLFLTGRLIRRLGVGAMLALLPFLCVVGFGALWLMSRGSEGAPDATARAAALHASLVTIAVFQVARRGVHYAVSQPSRQILFTQLGPEVIYKSKPFIDTFVYRGGDLFGAWAPKAIVAAAAAAGIGAASAVAGAAIPIAAASLGVGLVLGRMHRTAAARREAQDVAPSPASLAASSS